MTATPVERIRSYHAELKEVRHDIHAHPELAFEESRTSSIVAELLAGWGIEVHRGLAKTGVVGVIKGKKANSGKGVGLRADMDCLPMHETTALPYRSIHAGRMHACGHDGHTTMLLGAARYLAETRNFDGTAYLIFQPAEEGGGGGQVMVKEGLFRMFPADEIYALHNWPGLPPGKMAVGTGPMMAATDEIQIVVRGKGGHAAMPHLTVDPVVACAHIITALQTIASRNVSPVDAIVVSVCSMETSQIGAFNVIPDFVKLVGTVRSFLPETRELAEQRIREIVGKVAEASAAAPRSITAAAIPRRSTRRASPPSRRAWASGSSARTTSSPTRRRPWAARTFPTCCSSARAPTCSSARAADRTIVSCTIRATISTTR
jgi:hippurate hydrolase